MAPTRLQPAAGEWTAALLMTAITVLALFGDGLASAMR